MFVFLKVPRCKVPGVNGKFVAEITPPAETALETLKESGTDIGATGDIEMAPLVDSTLSATFTGLKDVEYKLTVWTVINGMKIVSMDLDTTSVRLNRIYPRFGDS